jgi:transglutaminase-like putative cysteine protease
LDQLRGKFALLSRTCRFAWQFAVSSKQLEAAKEKMRPMTVRHSTIYRYANAVTFGEHRMMVRPRDSHDLRLLSTQLTISPEPVGVRWLHDVFGNSVAIASFGTATANQIHIVSQIDLDHFERTEPSYGIEAYALTYPFSYSVDEAPDLTRLIERHYPDPDHALDLWAKRFVRTDGPTETLPMLTAITRSIKREFMYAARDAEGVQSPTQTLQLGSGTCRDFALLMMEAARALGLAARFISGYVYSPALDNGGNIGGGATHAWVQIYLPGAGWMEFDPTNGIVGNRDLIRVAVVRDPAQAIPIAGSWIGNPSDYLGMTVDVTISSR